MNPKAKIKKATRKKKSVTVEKTPATASNFTNMHQASAATGLSVIEIRKAKKAGCIAFRYGKIYKKELLDWIAAEKAKVPVPVAAIDESDTASDEEMESRKLRAQTLKAELELDIAKGKVINRDLVRTEWATNLSAIFEILDKSLDRGIYNSIVKEVKIYLGKKATQA